ncbi:LOW QUALITY PROTEIN: hypothetical protein CVT25_010277 [Psilocybe cyanescens]|uniref:Uncharacterized protein n=1 Tax=Psilocybe cyanescens TaxID=93625 RepID=A0A409X2S5_PSICY|nr:LOW QUALITY PROTEIN: hypothetical protein CVT25_010277 [Psilocybe cyanescens]
MQRIFVLQTMETSKVMEIHQRHLGALGAPPLPYVLAVAPDRTVCSAASVESSAASMHAMSDSYMLGGGGGGGGEKAPYAVRAYPACVEGQRSIVTPQNSDITTRKITSLLTAHRTLLAKLSLLHSRFLDVRACEEAREGVQRERDELRKRVERLVERVQGEHDYRKWPILALSCITQSRHIVPTLVLTLPYPPSTSPQSTSTPTSTHRAYPTSSPRSSPPNKQRMHARKPVMRHSRRESQGGRQSWRGLFVRRGASERYREKQRSKERGEERDGQHYRVWEGRSGDSVGVYTGIWIREKGVRVVWMSGVVVVVVMVMVRRRGVEVQRPVARNRMLRRDIRELSARRASARAASASVPASAVSSSSSTATSTPRVSSDKNNIDTKRAATLTRTLTFDAPTRARAYVSSSESNSKPRTIASGRARAFSPPPPLPLPPPRFPPPTTLAPAPATEKPQPQPRTRTQTHTHTHILQSLEREIGELGGRVDMLVRERGAWGAVVGARSAGGSGSGSGSGSCFGPCSGSGTGAGSDKQAQRMTGGMNAAMRTPTSLEDPLEDPLEDLRYRVYRLEA